MCKPSIFALLVFILLQHLVLSLFLVLIIHFPLLIKVLVVHRFFLRKFRPKTNSSTRPKAVGWGFGCRFGVSQFVAFVVSICTLVKITVTIKKNVHSHRVSKDLIFYICYKTITFENWLGKDSSCSIFFSVHIYVSCATSLTGERWKFPPWHTSFRSRESF